MSGTVFLEGDKINLRTVEEEDIEFLRNGVNHPDVRVHMGNRRPQNLENEQEFFEEQICDEDKVHLLITKNNERKGIISLIPKGSNAEKMAEIGIWLHPEHHGNGYGTESARLITEYGFKQLNYHKIYARAHTDNQASISLWKKLGFEKEGVFKDHTFTQGEYKDIVYYGILEGDWE
ncbi:MAG: GNAT family N-acetyltransferase [Nanohaloarchaea archaeon SW_7_43_1]|nr:MAG: GNAT family N-acetyltransferase [Nanohaloarchaea archaeon SW_7_43_1]